MKNVNVWNNSEPKKDTWSKIQQLLKWQGERKH